MSLALKTHANWSIPRNCVSPNCNHRQKVSLADLFATGVTGKFGGTVQESAFHCIRCDVKNTLPRILLPKGVFESLPLSRITKQLEPPMVITLTTGSLRERPPTSNDLPPPVVKKEPRLKGLAMLTSGGVKPASNNRKTAWAVGYDAFTTLRESVQLAINCEGDIIAFVHTPAGLAQVSLPDIAQFAYPGMLLDYLDSKDIALLIISIVNQDGSRSKTIFHPLAGAATLINEPA